MRVRVVRLHRLGRKMGAVGLLGCAGVVLAAPPAAAVPAPDTLTDTSQPLTATVPAGVCSIAFDVRGARGGGMSAATGPGGSPRA